MSVERNLESALDSYLYTLPDAPSIAWPNAPAPDVNGVSLWLRVDHLPRRTDAPLLGDTSALDYGGIYQISIHAAKDDSDNALLNMADTLIAHFPRGRTIGPVRVGQPYRSPAMDADGWRVVVVSVPYRGII